MAGELREREEAWLSLHPSLREDLGLGFPPGRPGTGRVSHRSGTCVPLCSPPGVWAQRRRPPTAPIHVHATGSPHMSRVRGAGEGRDGDSESSDWWARTEAPGLTGPPVAARCSRLSRTESVPGPHSARGCVCSP